MKVDRSNPIELFDWIWKRIDNAILKEAKPWIAEQLDEGNIEGLLEWGYNRLNKDNQAEVLAWLFDKSEASDTFLSNANNYLHEYHYDNGKHPIEAWKIINICMEGNQPLPEWAKEDLLQFSQKMLAIDTPGKAAAQEVFEAVGVRGNEFTQAHQQDRMKALCLEIEKLIGEGKSKAAAYRAYGKANNLKESTVKRYHVKESSNPSYWLWLGINPPK